MSIEIIEAKVEDVEQMFVISNKTWLDTYQNIEYDISEKDYTLLDLNKISEIIGKRKLEIKENPWSYFVAVDDWKIIWYAWSRKYDDYNELFAIYILKEYQWQGIWKQLVAKIFAYLWNSKSIIVNVVGYNKNAISFYEKVWFRFNKQLADFELVHWKLVPEIEMIYNFD